jgi:hypothetical protein
MARILLERFTNIYGKSWVRSHGSGVEGAAFCSGEIHSDADNVTDGLGQITCPDCIAFIEACKAISNDDLAPEYENELFNRRFERDR